MKKLFVLTAALAFSFAVMAQCPGKAQCQKSAQNNAVKADTEKTCADWKAEGKCPRTPESAPCSELKAAGKCPKTNTERVTTPRQKTSCARAEGQSTCCSAKKAGERTEASPRARKGGKRSERK